jgi:ABC-type glutathione transport system ATPase component
MTGKNPATSCGAKYSSYIFRDMGNANDYLLTVENLKTYFPVKKGLLRRTVGHIQAVDGVSFTIRRGQTLGLGRRKRLRQNNRCQNYSPPDTGNGRTGSF